MFWNLLKDEQAFQNIASDHITHAVLSQLFVHQFYILQYDLKGQFDDVRMRQTSPWYPEFPLKNKGKVRSQIPSPYSRDNVPARNCFL